MADVGYGDAGEAEAPKPKGGLVTKLADLLESNNIAADLEKTEKGRELLAEMAARVIEDYDIDKASRSQWEKLNTEAMKLAMMVSETKEYPFERASNVKFPLIAQAALQFNARAAGAIMQGDKVARCKTYGQDPDGAKAARSDRVSEHLSWQLLAEIPEWQPDMDRLLVILPIMGSDFKKTYYDPSLGRKCTRRVSAEKFVINYRARSLEDAPRFTEELDLYPRDVQERILDGRFIEFDYENVESDPTEKDKGDNSTQDRDAAHLFLEQHRLWDLDGDGYREPYIVTVHKGAEKVCRIVANYTADTVRMVPDGSKVAAIRPQTFFTKYEFLPSPDGGFYGMGLGWLLGGTNEAINSALNMLFDAAHLNNIQGGFVSSSMSLREKEIRIKPGHFKVINTGGLPLNQAVMPFQYPPPSEALFKLLGLMIEFGQKLASTTEVMSGETGGKVIQPMSLQILVDQGMKVFSAIFKRVHRAVTAELDIHARLNREHLTPEQYNEFFDDPTQQFDPKADYATKGMDILPVADPELATDTQALTQAQLIFETGNQNPAVNQYEMMKRLYTAAKVRDVDALLVPPPQPDPETEALMKRGAVAEVEDKEAGAAQKLAGAFKSVTDAQVATAGVGLDQNMMALQAIEAQHGMEMDQNAQAALGPGGLPGMAGPPGNPMGDGAAQGGGGAQPPAVGAGRAGPVPDGAGDMGIPPA